MTSPKAATWTGRELVPDEDTARQIGMAILNTYFGKDVIARFEPYSVSRHFGSWFIIGETEEIREARREERRTGNHTAIRGGGMPGMSISAQDARVESISYQR